MSRLAQAVSQAVEQQKVRKPRGPYKKRAKKIEPRKGAAPAKVVSIKAAKAKVASGLHAKPKNKILFLNTEGARAVVLKVLDAALTLPKESWLTLSDEERQDAERIVLRLRARL